MKKLLTAAATSIAVLALSVSAVAAGGPPQAGIYVNDVLYRTVGTPTDFSHTGAPAHAFDTIFLLNDGTNPAADGLASVATAAPGDHDYNGGRWMVLDITWINTPMQLTSEDEVLAAASAGDLSINWDPIKYFECPVIPMRGNSGH